MVSARAQNIPPRVTTARRPGGNGPLTRSFLPSIAARRGRAERLAGEGRSSTILRLFNPGDEDAEVVVRADHPIGQVFAVNFLEERQSALRVVDSAVELRLKPKQIQTIELVSQIQV